jgi:pantoate kinase
MEVKSSDFSDVFVSYRRVDVEFTKKLVEALQADGKQVWIDWEDIPPGSVGFSDDIKRGL